MTAEQVKTPDSTETAVPETPSHDVSKLEQVKQSLAKKEEQLETTAERLNELISERDAKVAEFHSEIQGKGKKSAEIIKLIQDKAVTPEFKSAARIWGQLQKIGQEVDAFTKQKEWLEDKIATLTFLKQEIERAEKNRKVYISGEDPELDKLFAEAEVDVEYLGLDKDAPEAVQRATAQEVDDGLLKLVQEAEKAETSTPKQEPQEQPQKHEKKSGTTKQVKRPVTKDPEELAKINSKVVSQFIADQQKAVDEFCAKVAAYKEVLKRYKPASRKAKEAETKIRTSAETLSQKLEEALKQRKADLDQFNEDGLLETDPEFVNATKDIAWFESVLPFFAKNVDVELLQKGDVIFAKLTTIPLAGKRLEKTVDGVKYAFRGCPAGSFKMGSPSSESGRDNDEGPQHEVTFTKGFWMLETEVTQAMWRSVMGSNPSHFKGDNLPVEQVSWDDCQEFCKKLSNKIGMKISLPTEAQWEYACRAGTTGVYAGDLDAMGWYSSNSGSETHPVGQKQANAWGLYDMHGNVWEWSQDWYGDYPSGSVTDPTGPKGGSHRVIRGGGWNYYAQYCRSAIRNGRTPGNRSLHLGFRLVGSAQKGRERAKTR